MPICQLTDGHCIYHSKESNGIRSDAVAFFYYGSVFLFLLEGKHCTCHSNYGNCYYHPRAVT